MIKVKNIMFSAFIAKDMTCRQIIKNDNMDMPNFILNFHNMLKWLTINDELL